MSDEKSNHKVSTKASAERESWFNRLAGFLFGYDFFISYAHSDAGAYANTLAENLKEKGFECFLDRKNFVKGDNWRIAGRQALKKTQRLVLLVSPDALSSEPVLMELRIFKGEGKRVIPINFDGTLNFKKEKSKLFEYISADDLWITESRKPIESQGSLLLQTPSDQAITDLTNSFNLERQEIKRLRWIKRFALLLVFLSFAAFAGAGIAFHQRSVAQENEKRAVSQLALSYLQRGVEQCQNGSLRSGVIFLLHGYEAAVLAKNSDLSGSARRLLAMWSGYLGPHTIHDAEVTEVTYSPDGRYYVSGDHQGSIAVLDKLSGKRLTLLTEHQDSITALVFSKDGSILITASRDGRAFIWDVPTFKRRKFVIKHSKSINSVSINSDGNRIATGSNDKTASICRLSEETCLDIPGHAKRVGVVRFTPDGTILATGSNDKSVRLWNAIDGSPIGSATLQGPVNSLAFTPNGKLLAVDDQKVIRILDVATQQSVTTTSPHARIIGDLAISPDGKYLISGSLDNTARLWKTTSGKPVGSALVHGGQIHSVDYSPTGDLVATADWYNVARVWHAPSGRALSAPFLHGGGVLAISIDPTGKSILTGSDDGRARVWNFSQELPEQKFLASPKTKGGLRITGSESADAIAFSPNNNTILAAGISGHARAWNVETGEAVSEPLNHDDIGVDLLEYSPSGAYAFTASSRTVQLWNVGENISKGKRLDHPKEVFSVAFLSDDHILTGSKDKTVRVWNASTGRMIDDTAAHETPVNLVTVSPKGGRYFTASAEGTGKLWDADTRSLIPHTIRHEKAISDAVFSPDGNYLVTGSYDGTAVIWDITNGAQRNITLTHGATVLAVAIHPDAQLVATAGEDQVARIWHVHSEAGEGFFLRHNDIVSDVAFSPDGTIIATASHDRTAMVWDTNTGLPLTRPLDHNGNPVEAVAFSPDGRYLATGATDLIARVWNISYLKRFQSVDDQTLALFIESLTGLTWHSSNNLRDLTLQEIQARQMKTSSLWNKIPPPLDAK